MKIKNIKSTAPMPIWKFICIVALAVVFAPVTLILLYPLIRLKTYCKAKNYVVTKIPAGYENKVKLIAHRGFRAVAPENTLPAFEEAGKANFWGAENDIHRTKDGVWVLHHDSHTFRMMNKDLVIEKSNYADLMELCVDNGSNVKDYPNLKIAKLEDYLEICARYNMKAFIELKGELNTEHYGEIVELVKKYNVDASYISFEKIAITSMRKLTDAKLFYIVYQITQDAVDFAKSVENCGIDFDANDKRNQSKDKVGMILNAGLTPALWALDDSELLKNYADWGVEYITTNQICY